MDYFSVVCHTVLFIFALTCGKATCDEFFIYHVAFHRTTCIIIVLLWLLSLCSKGKLFLLLGILTLYPTKVNPKMFSYVCMCISV